MRIFQFCEPCDRRHCRKDQQGWYRCWIHNRNRDATFTDCYVAVTAPKLTALRPNIHVYAHVNNLDMIARGPHATPNEGMLLM